MTERHTAVFERDDEGNWLVGFPEFAGLQTYGRSLRQAQDSARDALALWLNKAIDDVEVVPQFKLADDAGKRLEVALEARHVAEAAMYDAYRRLEEFIVAGTESGLTRREMGAMVGLSFQRIQQIHDRLVEQGTVKPRTLQEA
jgi:predicted RNase H-like HicB family nuclease